MWVRCMRKNFATIIALAAFVGIFLKVFVDATDGDFNILRGLSALRYFTIQSNLIVALYFSMFFIKPIRNNKIYQRYLGAVTIYITVTFLIFVFFLQPIYHPTGWAGLSSILSHYIVPITSITYFILYREEVRFQYNEIPFWLVFPVLYLVFVILLGAFTGDYIYPFFQVNQIGIPRLIINCIGLFTLFLLLSFMTVKMVSKPKK